MVICKTTKRLDLINPDLFLTLLIIYSYHIFIQITEYYSCRIAIETARLRGLGLFKRARIPFFVVYLILELTKHLIMASVLN